ncbi:class I adenylate-forming enzyme family protein [Paenibacillus xylanilyticus]|uniref:Acyl--CoA ligase n=1 Tax=Paenibacillus xylanilyticus TaxID=248903 RepID=A0A7Y6EZZ0_9BACL|nr:class I adenylate-forming enzyme family protein [Paenibacillus xylanilyticus]NUU80155.1 acyl--CoA ligase [Paenibacillus xylanilyticus]
MFLFERLPLAASLFSDAPALLRYGQKITYGELYHFAEKLGRAFYAEGLQPGDRLAILGDPDPQMVVSLYAAVEVGAIPTVISPLLSPPEIAAILENAEPKFLIHDNRHAKAAYSAVKLLSRSPILFATEEGSVSDSVGSILHQNLELQSIEAIDRKMEDTAVLIFTGGTTGRPKGVMHSHLGISAWNQCTPTKGLGYDMDRRVLVLNLSHLVGQFQLWATMAAGGCLVFLDEYPANVQRIVEAVEREQISHLSTVGQLLRDLTSEVSVMGKDLPSLKVIGCGGSVISPDTLKNAVQQFPGALIVNNYSQAECGMAISRLLPALHMDDPIRLRSVGRPSDFAAQGEKAFQVRIVTEEGQDALDNEPGEIVVRGSQTMLGYWHQPEASSEAISNGWIRTGDVGCLDGEGYLYVLDRFKDMVIINGSNVFCPEVEQVIMTHEQVIEVAVIGLPQPNEGEELVACIVLREGGSLELEGLWAFCELRLAQYKWPTKIYILDTLPRTAVDKVDKKRLRMQVLL